MTLHRWLVTLLVLSGSAILAGCGFHLAGRAPVPPQLQSVYVDYVDPYHVAVPPLQTALVERLKRGGARVVSSPQQASAILRLSGLTQAREAVSIGPDGRALEYRLITSIQYELAANGKVLLPPERQTVSSDYSFNAQQILAKEEEETRLENYIQDELADLVLLRIRARLTHLPAAERAPASATSSAVSPPSS